MSEVKRWDISYSERYGFDKEEDPNGEYVEWEDHASAISAKDSKIAELEELVDRCIITLDAYDIEATALDDARLYVTAQQQAEPVMQVSPEVSKQISKRGRDAIMAAERLVTLDESKTVSLEDMESRFGVEPATHSEDGGEAFALHMGDASRLFDLIATDQISRCVDCEQFGAMGATEVTYWNTKVGLILERRNSMGGMSVYLHAAQSGRQVGEPRLISYAEDMSTCTLTLGDGFGYFYNRVTDAELDAEDARQQSEDGGEAPEVVAELILGGIDGNEAGDNDIVVHSKIVEGLQDRMVTDIDDVLAPLMTVAQHERITKQLREEAATAKARQDHAEMVGDDLSRIVAAKDWEISTITAWWRAANVRALEAEEKVSKMEDCAQPARQAGDVQLTGEYHADVNMLLERIPRQVGGGERAEFGQWFCDEFKKLSPSAGVAMHLAKELYWTGWQARAALAPAAVVMPERDDYHQIAFEIGGTEDGAYHFEADELDAFVARLNRRTIPLELMKRILDHLDYDALGSPSESTASDLAGELRALLGKS